MAENSLADAGQGSRSFNERVDFRGWKGSGLFQNLDSSEEYNIVGEINP